MSFTLKAMQQNQKPHAAAAAVCPAVVSSQAQILECLGEAGEVIRVAAASRCLWAAAAGPLPHVHTLVLRSSTQDLASLQQRFPNIQQLHVADGCRQWTCLGTWAASLRVLQANGTSFPLAAVLSPSLPRVSSASRPRHPHRQQHQQQQQYQQQQHQHQADVPAELRNLVHLQLQSTVTSAVKCRQHGSQCDCLVSEWLCRTAVSGVWCVSLGADSSSHFRGVQEVRERVAPAGQPEMGSHRSVTLIPTVPACKLDYCL